MSDQAQPTLFESYEFEGETVVSIETQFGGTSKRVGRLSHGQRAVIVIECDIKDIQHPNTRDGLKRKQIGKILDGYLLDGKDGRRLLSYMRTSHEEGSNKLSLPFPSYLGDKIVRDENGVALTPSEVAAAQGIEYPEPRVLILEDKARALWPDDWGQEANLAETPGAGDFIRLPGSSAETKVVEVHDCVTGEPIEIWTDEMENERLLEQEREAEAEEKLHKSVAALGDPTNDTPDDRDEDDPEWDALLDEEEADE